MTESTIAASSRVIQRPYRLFASQMQTVRAALPLLNEQVIRSAISGILIKSTSVISIQ